jgi:uncharacterized membrane protein
LILVIGAVLRFYDIGQKSLWRDEFYSLQASAGHVDRNSNHVRYSPLGVIPALGKDTDVPLYFMLLNLWIRVFGNSEVALRSLSAIFGIGAIFLIYLVARALLHERVGLISALILMLAPAQVYYAQEARAYALQVFLVLLSTYFFIRIVFSKDMKLAFWLGYLISALLGVYTHYFTVLVYFCHNLFLILCRRDLFFTKRWLLSQFTLVLAWLLPFFTMFYITSFDWVTVKSSSEPYWPYAAFPYALSKFTFAEYAQNIMRISRAVLGLGILLFAVLFLAGVVALLKNYGFEKALFLFMWLCIPIFSLIAIDLVQKTKASALLRYVIAASPAYYIILASAIVAIRSKYLNVFIIAAVVLLLSIALSQYYVTPKYEQWREAAQAINGSTPRADLVFFYPGGFDFINYYIDRPVPEKIISVGEVSELENISKDLNLIFIVVSTRHAEKNPNDLDQIVALMGTYYDLAEVRPLRGVKVLKYARRAKDVSGASRGTSRIGSRT